jgi:hypothetical protein
LKPAKKTVSSKAERSMDETTPAQPPQCLSEKLTVDLKTDKGQMTIVGTATAVIAALAVIGLIIISIYVVKLAERAIDRTDNVPVKTGPR